MPTVEQNRRSLAKSVSFRIIVIIVDTVVAYALTRRVDLTAGFVIFSNVTSTILYYVHERLWARSKWGNGVHSDSHLDSNRASISSSSQPK